MADSYRHTMKATVIMGGAQLSGALASLVRAKVIAVFLGPAGIAVNNIFQQTINTTYQVASMGLPLSAVRDISRHDNDTKRRSTINGFMTLIVALSVVAMGLFMAGAPLLNLFSFGTGDNYTFDFIILGAALLLFNISQAHAAILQGTRELPSLAKSIIIGNVVGILIGIPIYIYVGLHGIVFAITLGYFITMLANGWYVRRRGHGYRMMRLRKAYSDHKPMIQFGAAIMASGLLMNLYGYVGNALIRYWGSLHDVGFYQGALSLTQQNFALLTAALIADYYPRLSAQLADRKAFNQTVTEQCEVLLILTTAVCLLLIGLAPLIIQLLLSGEFLRITPLTRLMACSLFFRVFWIVLAFIPLAHGDKRIYFVMDAIVCGGVQFALSMLAYYVWGLQGVGYSYILSTLLVSLIMYVAYHRIYHFRLNQSVIRLAAVCLALVTLMQVSMLMPSAAISNCAALCIGLFALIYLYRSLNKRIHLLSFIKKHHTSHTDDN